MKIRALLPTLLIVLALVLSACTAAQPTQAPATSAPVEPPVVEQPTQEAAQTEAPAEEATQPPAPEATQEQPPPEPTEEPAAERTGGTLRFGLRTADLSSLDPHFATNTADRTVVDMIFNGLVRYKPGDASQFEPDLATELPEAETVDGKQVWTIQLREGVMCHPSDAAESYELTSEDVVYSLQKSADEARSAFSGEYAGMTVAALDPTTVEITLDTPISPALFYPKISNYSGGFIVCQQAYENMSADDAKVNPVGTGPFMFESYTPQTGIMLTANPDYFRGQPQLDAVDLRYVADLTALELALRSGELDVINGGPDQAWVDKMNQVEGIDVDVFGVGEVAVLYFNTNIEPLDDPLVREAIVLGLDREEFLAIVGGEPYAAIVYSPVPVQFLPGGLTQEEVAAAGVEYPTDRDRAKELLTEAGFPDGFSLDLISSEMAGYRTMYESLQNQLSQIGITSNIQVVDHNSFHSMIREDLNPLVLYIAWRPNADVYLTRFFHSDSIVVTGAKPDTNFSHYDKIDDLILDARAETDPEAQAELWKQAQIQIMEDLAAFPLQYQNQVYGRSEKVDYGHELKSVLALYPGINETTRLNP